MGIDALGRLIKLSPEIAEQHQLAVIDCLEVRLLPLSAHDTNHSVGVCQAIGLCSTLSSSLSMLILLFQILAFKLDVFPRLLIEQCSMLVHDTGSR